MPPHLARRDARERVFNGLSARRIHLSFRACEWRVVRTFNIQRVEQALGPGRRVYPSAVAATISGVDPRWS
jgi:hypothetical protein